MNTYTLLPNPFTEAPIILLEELHKVTQNPAVLWYVPATPLIIKSVELFVRGDFRQLITRDCDLDLDFLDLRVSIGGWFVFGCSPPHALEHYSSYERCVLGMQDPHKTFGCKHFEIYESDGERLYVPHFEDTYEMQIECTVPLNGTAMHRLDEVYPINH